jgi:hypothetical protein
MLIQYDIFQYALLTGASDRHLCSFMVIQIKNYKCCAKVVKESKLRKRKVRFL